MQIQAQQGQTVYDIALFAYGDPSAIYDLAGENTDKNISAISDLTGMLLNYTPRRKSNQKEAVKNIKVTGKTVTISSDQTVFDLALQYYGSPEKVFQLLAENPGIDGLLADNIGGKVLNFTESTDFASFYYRTNKLMVATKYPSQFESRITEDSQIRALENNQNRIVE